MSGRFITFEGIEGCGKTTQIECLKVHLEGLGHRVCLTREPGGTVIGEAIRAILLNPTHTTMSPSAELLLYEAARAQLVGEVIQPALKEGTIVLCDRFYDSTIAYQGAGRGIASETVHDLNGFASGGLAPHRTYLLDLPAEVGMARVKARRGLDRIEQESIDFHARVRKGFLTLAEREPERFLLLDAREPIESLSAIITSDARSLLEAT